MLWTPIVYLILCSVCQGTTNQVILNATSEKQLIFYPQDIGDDVRELIVNAVGQAYQVVVTVTGQFRGTCIDGTLLSGVTRKCYSGLYTSSYNNFTLIPTSNDQQFTLAYWKKLKNCNETVYADLHLRTTLSFFRADQYDRDRYCWLDIRSKTGTPLRIEANNTCQGNLTPHLYTGQGSNCNGLDCFTGYIGDLCQGGIEGSYTRLIVVYQPASRFHLTYRTEENFSESGTFHYSAPVSTQWRTLRISRLELLSNARYVCTIIPHPYHCLMAVMTSNSSRLPEEKIQVLQGSISRGMPDANYPVYFECQPWPIQVKLLTSYRVTNYSFTLKFKEMSMSWNASSSRPSSSPSYHWLQRNWTTRRYSPTPSTYHWPQKNRTTRRYSPTQSTYHWPQRIRTTHRYSPTPSTYYWPQRNRTTRRYSPTQSTYHWTKRTRTTRRYSPKPTTFWSQWHRTRRPSSPTPKPFYQWTDWYHTSRPSPTSYQHWSQWHRTRRPSSPTPKPFYQWTDWYHTSRPSTTSYQHWSQWHRTRRPSSPTPKPFHQWTDWYHTSRPSTTSYQHWSQWHRTRRPSSPTSPYPWPQWHRTRTPPTPTLFNHWSKWPGSRWPDHTTTDINKLYPFGVSQQRATKQGRNAAQRSHDQGSSSTSHAGVIVGSVVGVIVLAAVVVGGIWFYRGFRSKADSYKTPRTDSGRPTQSKPASFENAAYDVPVNGVVKEADHVTSPERSLSHVYEKLVTNNYSNLTKEKDIDITVSNEYEKPVGNLYDNFPHYHTLTREDGTQHVYDNHTC